MTIKVLDSTLEAKQGLFKGDLLVKEEIVSNTLELIMGNLFDCENEVSRYHVGYLLSLSFED